MALSQIDKANRLSYLRAIADDYAMLNDPDTVTSLHPVLVSRFSLRNVMLILAQRPDATECAGFHDWRKVGRSVRKGAKGVAILVPMTGKDDEGERVTRFSYRYVFDISDTDPVNADELALV
jgi:hypothetical protein